MNYKYYYGILQIIIGVLISIFVESVASGELLFTNGILADSLRKKIIEHPKSVIIGLLVLNFIAYLLYQYFLNKEEMKSFLNHLFMTKNLKKKKLLKKVKVNKYQKKLLPKMLKRLKKK